jgi:uracil phosphoribosyltransferase
MRLLVEDALAEFPHDTMQIETPCGPCSGMERRILSVISDYNNNDTPSSGAGSTSCNLCAVSIVRSGDALVDVVRDVEPSCKVGKILIQRDEESVDKNAKLLYYKLPTDINSCYVLLCDPMLATGGSAVAALDVLCKTKYHVDPTKIVFANVISCPEGLRVLAQKYPDVTIVTIKVDSHLNDDKYIVPGLGDFGDRFYNT